MNFMQTKQTHTRKERFFIAWAEILRGWAVYDRHKKVKGSPYGFAIIHGTDSPVRELALSDCRELNRQQQENGKTHID
jgi:hypothetical protein